MSHGADVIANHSIPKTPVLILSTVVLNCLPKLEAANAEGNIEGELLLEVCCNTVKWGEKMHKSTLEYVQYKDRRADYAVKFGVNCLVQGDIQVSLYTTKSGLLGGKKVSKVLFVQFHTTMCVDSPSLEFPKSECDNAAFDKRFPPNFQLSLVFEEVEEISKEYDSMGEDDIIQNVQNAKIRNGTTAFFYSEKTKTEVMAKIKEARSFSSPVSEQIEKAGYLCKQGLTVRNWKDRWFILRGSSLSYFKSPKNATPNGIITLESIYTVSLMKNKKVDPSQPYPHSLVLRTEQRDFVVCSANVVELEDWAEAINIAGQQVHQKDLMSLPAFGKLFVVVLGAQNLITSYVGSQSSLRAYCVAILARQKYTTAVDETNGPNPRWPHQVLEFNLQALTGSLQITVWDDVPGYAPRFCGQIQVGIHSLMAYRVPTSLWFPLSKRTTLSLVSGHVHLLLYYNDLKAEDPESLDALAQNINFMANYEQVRPLNQGLYSSLEGLDREVTESLRQQPNSAEFERVKSVKVVDRNKAKSAENMQRRPAPPRPSSVPPPSLDQSQEQRINASAAQPVAIPGRTIDGTEAKSDDYDEDASLPSSLTIEKFAQMRNDKERKKEEVMEKEENEKETKRVQKENEEKEEKKVEENERETRRDENEEIEKDENHLKEKVEKEGDDIDSDVLSSPFVIIHKEEEEKKEIETSDGFVYVEKSDD